MNPRSRIAVLSPDEELHQLLALRIESKGYHAVSLPEPSQVLGIAYADPPDVIIIDLARNDPTYRDVLRDLKQDSYFGVIPVIGLLAPDVIESFPWDQYPLDDFLLHPIDYRDLFSRIELSLQRIQRIFDNNPLTKLPGNTSIQHAIEQSFGKSLAVCYLDINHFKPYNDTYGFSRGDEVLRMTARVLSNTVRESKEPGFVGHIGGDDFVFIVPLDKAESICKTVIGNFKIIESDLFGEEEKLRGHYVAKDRKGVEQKFPLLGISIAIVPLDNKTIQHAGKVAEIAAELKKVAKKSNESSYVIDRRKY